MIAPLLLSYILVADMKGLDSSRVVIFFLSESHVGFGYGL